MKIEELIEYLEFKDVVKKPIKYTFMNVQNVFSKLKRYSFTICTKETELEVKIAGKVETKRKVSLGDFVIRGPSKDIYSTTADRFFSSYEFSGEANVIQIRKSVATLTKKDFKKLNLPIPYTYKGPFGADINVFPGDGIIRDYSTDGINNEYFRIDPAILKQTYDYI
jgi:hypothetical protein